MLSSRFMSSNNFLEVATVIHSVFLQPIFLGRLYKTARDRLRQLRVVSIRPIDGLDEKFMEFNTALDTRRTFWVYLAIQVDYIE